MKPKFFEIILLLEKQMYPTIAWLLIIASIFDYFGNVDEYDELHLFLNRSGFRGQTETEHLKALQVKNE